MKPKNDDSRGSRPMSPDEMRDFEENVIHGGDEPASGDVLGPDVPEEDRLTKSGRLKVTDVEQIEKERR